MILFSFCDCHWLIPWLLPFLLGLLIAWIIRTPLKKRVGELEEENANLRNKIGGLESELSDCRAKRASLDSELTLLKQIQKEKEANESSPKANKNTSTNLSGSISSTRAPDDLKKVDGIGPKIEKLLNADEIFTFRDLADAEISLLKKILDAAGSRFQLADPSSWKKQSEMAANGRWNDLKEYLKMIKKDK